MNEAQLRGIDLDQLESERFSHPQHYRMMKQHFDRVRAFELAREVNELRERLDQFPEKVKENATKIREGKTVRTPLTLEADYVFTDIQLKIAEESLARHAGQTNDQKML